MPRADASRRRCAIYTRKSSEEGLEQEFNSLAAASARSGSVSSVNLLSSSTGAKRCGYVLVPS